jgi:DNA-binding transcriptional LysR family regulator
MRYIETRLFHYFVAVAEEQHFTRAALRLKITPPTLTEQIKKLESDLGLKLLERGGNTPVLLTDAGMRFLGEALQVLRQVEHATAVARQAARGELGRLDIGFVRPVSFAGLLRTWLAGFKRANPAIDITMHKLVPTAQIAELERKKLDAGFTRAPHKYPAGVQGFEIYRQPLVLALPSQHPLARRKDIAPAMLKDETFVNTTPELAVQFWGHMETIAEIGNFMPRVVKRDDDFDTVLTHVSLGYGIAVVPKLTTRTNVANVVFREIAAKPVPLTSIAFVYRRDASPAGTLLIKHMRRYALPQHKTGAPEPIRAVCS